VKHAYPGRTVENLGRLKPQYDGSVANTFLMDPGLSYIYAPFCEKIDTFVDAHKFLLHLQTCSLLKVRGPQRPIIVRDPYEWGKDPNAFSPVRAWAGASKQLSKWTGFNRYKRCATQEFDLRASAGKVTGDLAIRNPRFREQATAKYSMCFEYNYPNRLHPKPDPSAAQSGNLFPISEKLDLSKEGVASTDSALVDYSRLNLGNVLNNCQNSRVVEEYSIQRLMEVAVPPVRDSHGQVCPQPNLAGPPLNINTGVSTYIDDPMEIDENPEVPQLNPFAGPRNEEVVSHDTMNIDI
jgi:hypothetical protein